MSINNLSRIETSSFLNLKSLEYLDLSDNKIQFIDENIFSLINNLKYLNLENNRIDSVGMTFLNYLNLQVINLSNNQLRFYPGFFRKKTVLAMNHVGFMLEWEKNVLSMFNLFYVKYT